MKECELCAKKLSSWDLRCSNALAYKLPRCEGCIAAEYEKTTEGLRTELEEWFGIRPCIGI